MQSLNDRLQQLRHVVLDMDGTIYLGDALFAGTLPFLDVLNELNIGHTYITNNNSRSRAEYVGKLRAMGISALPDQIFTSAHATVEYLSTKLPDVHDVFVLGTPGLVEDLQQGEINIVRETKPDAVVIGFDQALDYDRIGQAAFWIKQGLPYLATHPDLVCPTDKPTVLPDCGAICALLEAAAGRRPDAIPGKPSPEMLAGVMHRHGLAPNETAMIGDRIYTDIQMACDAGVLAVLTLTGEASAEQADASTVQPDLVVANLDEFARRLRAARR